MIKTNESFKLQGYTDTDKIRHLNKLRQTLYNHGLSVTIYGDQKNNWSYYLKGSNAVELKEAESLLLGIPYVEETESSVYGLISDLGSVLEWHLVLLVVLLGAIFVTIPTPTVLTNFYIPFFTVAIVGFVLSALYLTIKFISLRVMVNHELSRG